LPALLICGDTSDI